MLEEEFKYFLDHQEELVKRYDGKYLIIRGKNVVDVYDNEQIAYFESEKKYDLGTFLIQYCEAGEKAYAQSFHSRVNFD